MKINPDKLIKSILGEDFFEDLKKSVVFKMNNRSVTSLDEVSTGLKIVPRAVMSFLLSSLSHLQAGDNKDLELPFVQDCYMQVTKKDADVFSGYIYSKGKKINEFSERSIPGIGLVLMTTFEMYEVEDLKTAKQKEKESFDIEKLQEMIDERLRLHSLVNRIVDQKIAQKDAVEILVKEKLKQAISERTEEKKESVKSEKLKQFLQKNKQQEIEIQKRESINCPDCGSNIYDGGKNLTLCICYGQDWNKSIKIQKSEQKIKMKFSKNIDKENIQMLLDTLRNINKE